MMVEIVSDLEKALNNYVPKVGEAIYHALKKLMNQSNQESLCVWESDYPIAVVHKKVRIKELDILEQFESKGLLNTRGETSTRYTQEEFDFLANNTPKYIKRVNLMCLKSKEENLPTFEPKRENDYWKKLVNTGNYRAVVEFTSFGTEADVCNIEKVGRDIMRSRKEVHTVRELGFVWIVEVDSLINLDTLFQLYFGENYKKLTDLEHTYFIGWSDTLQGINMRDFICPPVS